MARPPIETGNPWIALVVALGALGAAVWFFAGADDAALDVPTTADRLAVIADDHPDDTDLLVLPTRLPAGWDEPGIEVETDGDRLERFVLRLLRRYEDPDKPDAFVQVRLRVCTSATDSPCQPDATAVREAAIDGTATVVTIDDERFAEDVRTAWADVDFTSDWSSLDWPTRRR